MNEINKADVRFTQSVKNFQPEAKAETKAPAAQADNKDYKEAAAAPGAEVWGRSQVYMNKVSKTEDKDDNINEDIASIIKNPKLADDSEALFDAAEKAGIPYPVAASFATSELTEK